MKIAYFIGTLKKEDGATRVLLALICEAQKKGIESVIVTGWAEDESISPVPIIQVPAIIFPFYKEYRLPLPGMRGFKKQLDEFKPDILHVHSPDTSAWAALKYSKKRQIPIIATYHTDFVSYLTYYHLSYLRSAVWFLLRRLYTRMSFVTTPSQIVSDELSSRGVSNIKTIPWGVDITKFNSSFRSLEWRQQILQGDNKMILLCVGRLTWEKNLRIVATTYNLLRERRSDFVMVVAGDGPARQELEALMPGATFLGHIEGVELSTTYASSDILLFPSSTETFGNVTIEAIASRLVPVVADAGGSKSLVRYGENGFLARPNDSEDFYKKVELLLDDQMLRKQMQESGWKFVENFTWEKVFGSFLQIYQKLLIK